MRILKLIWPNVIKELAKSLHELSEALGDDHDLAELQKTLVVLQVSNDKELQDLSYLIDQKRLQIQSSVRKLGDLIYFEKPALFTGRIAAYWNSWHQVVSILEKEKIQ
jgi:hypothetical protein